MSDSNLSAKLRVRCHLLGCNDSPSCDRCGTDLYDPDYLQRGWLDPLILIWWRARRLLNVNNRCTIDGCLLRKGHEGEHDDIPF